MGGMDLNNRSNTLKTLSTYGTIAGRIENKKAQKVDVLSELIVRMNRKSYATLQLAPASLESRTRDGSHWDTREKTPLQY